MVHRGLGLYTAHHRKPWRAHHLQHRVPHVRRGGAHEASLETSGTAAGWKRGRGPSAFFGNPMLLRSAPQPAIRLHLLRDPVSRPLARPQRGHAGLLARRDFARSRIRCSWRLGPVRFRHASSQADDGDEHEAAPQKNCHGPSLRPHPPRNPTFHARWVQPETGKRSPGYGITAERGLDTVGVSSPGSAATQPTKNQEKYRAVPRPSPPRESRPWSRG
jgi:hypothetical protein